MVVTQEDRFKIRQWAIGQLGEQAGGALMELNSPENWPDIARRSDIDRLGARIHGLDTRMDGLDTRMDGLDTRMDGLDTRMDGLESRMDRFDIRMDRLEVRMDAGFNGIRQDMRTQLFWLLGFFTTLQAAFAAVTLG